MVDTMANGDEHGRRKVWRTPSPPLLAIISANTLNFARTLGCTHKQTHNHEIEATTSIVLRRTHLLGCVSHLVRVVLPPGDGTQRRCWREGPICTPTVSAENAP